MIKGTNMLGKDNPRWTAGNATETIKLQVAGSPDLRGPAVPRPGRRPPGHAGMIADAFRAARVCLSRWLAGIVRRAGARLFARNDEEAGWRGWQITELHCGLARSYRDARFDMLLLIREIDGSMQEPDACPLDGDR